MVARRVAAAESAVRATAAMSAGRGGRPQPARTDLGDKLRPRAQREGAHGVVAVELAVGGEVEVEQVEVDLARERAVVERGEHEARGLHDEGLHLVRRADRPLLEEVGVVAHLAQLHEHVHDAEKGARAQRVARLPAGHKVLVEQPLALRERARYDVLDLILEALLDVLLEAAQQEGAQDLVQPLDDVLVDRLGALDHPGDRVAEPVLELPVTFEDVRHQKVQQRPQLHEVVLQRRASEQQPPLRVEVEQRLPPL